MTHRELDQLQRDWDDLAATDPLWAILWHPARRHRRWDLGAFLATGEREIAELMERSEALGRPVARKRALDFGCGVGRLTRALATRFGEVIGVDISATMLEQARRVNADRPNCTFVHNAQSDLSLFGDGWFDLAYTNLVLQHQPNRSTAERYISELVRVLAPAGLLAFQMPGPMSLRYRLRPRRRLYHALRALGLPITPFERRLELSPIRMLGLPEARVAEIVRASGGTILAIEVEPFGATSIDDRTFFVTR